jgi:hypothetical protein
MKPFDDAVEAQAVVEAAPGERLDPLDMARRVVRAQLDATRPPSTGRAPSYSRASARRDRAQHGGGAARTRDRRTLGSAARAGARAPARRAAPPPP